MASPAACARVRCFARGARVRAAARRGRGRAWGRRGRGCATDGRRWSNQALNRAPDRPSTTRSRRRDRAHAHGTLTGPGCMPVGVRRGAPAASPASRRVRPGAASRHRAPTRTHTAGLWGPDGGGVRRRPAGALRGRGGGLRTAGTARHSSPPGSPPCSTAGRAAQVSPRCRRAMRCSASQESWRTAHAVRARCWSRPAPPSDSLRQQSTEMLWNIDAVGVLGNRGPG